MLFPFGLIAIVIGFNCRNRVAKGMFFSLATALAVVAFAGIAMFLIDLPQCRGDFLSGMFCPAEIERTFAYRAAYLCARIWIYGLIASPFIGAPICVVALVIEARN